MRSHQSAFTLVCLVLPIFLIACGGANTNSSNPSNPSENHVFAGFASRLDTPGAGTTPKDIAVVDFNGDGNPDIATSWQSNQIAIYLGRGDGTFRTPIVTNVTISGTLGNIAIGDFNEDGHPDIVAATIGGSESNLVFLGKGDGTFQSPTTIPNSFGFLQARVIDINGDKHQDLVMSGNGSNWIFLGAGDGTFTAAPALPPPVPSPNTIYPGAFIGLAVDDFNGDKKIDFVVADAGPQNGSLDFYAGNGDGTFQPPARVAILSYGPGNMSIADFNRDGKSDLLIGFKGQMAQTLLGNGSGSFVVGESYAPYLPSIDQQSSFSVATADFNLDGHPDVVTVDSKSGTVSALLNDGSGKLGIGSPSTPNFTLAGLAQTVRVIVADVNKDGIPDIVTVSAANNVLSVFLATKK